MMFASRRTRVSSLIAEEVVTEFIARQLHEVAHRLAPVPLELLVGDAIAIAALDRANLPRLDLPRDGGTRHAHRVGDLFGGHHAALRRPRQRLPIGCPLLTLRGDLPQQSRA